MVPLARGYSFVLYQAQAGATYTVPFPFLHAEDVHVFAGDVGDAVPQSFVWTGPTDIKLAVDAPEHILITIRRFTKRDTTLVVVQEGAQLPARDLNLNSTQLLYILQELIDFGTSGKGLPGGGSGWPGQGGSGSEIIQQIIDQLMQSPVMTLLTSRLTDIDNTAETMLDEILRSDAAFDYRRENAARVALVETRITTVQDTTHAMAERITDVYAKFDNAEAQIHSVQKAVSDSQAATASTFEGVNARFKQNEADITTVRQSVATETEARATAIQQVSATLDKANARITTVQQAVADETGSRTQAIQKAYSDFRDADGAVTKAVNETLQTTYATKNYAQSIAQTQVEAFAGGHFAQLQERFEALVDGKADPQTPGAWQANWTGRINGGSINGVPVIAGIGLGVDSKTGSNFIVMADRFGIVSPTYTTNGGVQQMKYPFVVGTVGGVSTVGITGQLIVDGSITADKIRANTLSAISANMGEVNGGTFRTYQLDGNGNIINPLEFRAELTNKPEDNYPVWVGAGAKNWNNAVFAVDRQGNAKFAGTITAQNMIGTLQQSTKAAWTGDVTAASNGTSATFVLPAPVRLGEQHLPIIQVECEIHNPAGNGATGGIYLERLVGATWVAVKTHNHYINGAATDFDAMLAFDAITSADTQYRVRIGNDPYNPSNGGNFHVTAVTAYAFGLR